MNSSYRIIYFEKRTNPLTKRVGALVQTFLKPTILTKYIILQHEMKFTIKYMSLFISYFF